METIKRTFDAVMSYLEEKSDSELVNIHNIFCEENNDMDDQIFSNNEDFFETFFSGQVTEAVRAATYGDFNFRHNWVKFDGYANLYSFDGVETVVDFRSLVSSILDNPGAYDIELEEEEEKIEEEEN